VHPNVHPLGPRSEPFSFPRSHCSGPLTMPSPQKAPHVHLVVQPPYVLSLFGPGHPPGTGIVPSPQSHSSPASRMRSPHRPPWSLPPSQLTLPSSWLPQIRVQGFPGTRHCHPGSIVWQSPEQPSPLTVFPSSHASLEVRIPFPHRNGSTQVCPGIGRHQPVSS